MIKFVFIGAILVLALIGCASLPRTLSPVAVTIARGPCFGFCPVYDIQTIGRDHVRFEGVRHTASLGVTIKQVSPAALAKAVGQLAPYRPSAGSSNLDCVNGASDQAIYTITWRNPGRNDTQSLSFNSGCPSAECRSLKSILDEVPMLLGLEAEAHQVTRPGATRG